MFVFNLLEHFEFHIQVVKRGLGPKKSSRSVMAITKLHIFGAGQFVYGCCKVVSHFRIIFVVWRSEKDKNNFILEKSLMKRLFEINKLVFLGNLIRLDPFLMGIFPFREYYYRFNRCGCKGATAVGNCCGRERERTAGRSLSIFPYVWVISILGNSLFNSKVCCFQIHFVNFYRSIQMAAIMLQTIAAFTQKIQKKVSLFLQKQMKITLFVKTTASLVTTIKRVLYLFVKITLYYSEKLRNCCIN